MLGGLVATLGLVEPPSEKKLSPREHAKNLRAVLASVSWSSPLGRTTVLYAVLSSATLTAVWLLQPHWKWIGVDVAWFGFLWAGLNLAVAFSAKLAPLVEVFSLVAVPIGWVGDRHGLGAAMLAAAAVFGLLGPASWAGWRRGRAAKEAPETA